MIRKLVVLTFGLVLFPIIAKAADPEGCLNCHRYRGLARMEKDQKTVRLFYVDSNYYDRALGPHARLRCTDCHNRKEVNIIPHHKVGPVDCTRTCHLESPEKMEIQFSHARIANMLKSSVHDRGVLATANGLLGKPLRPDQSDCLLCHDEPTFRRTDQTWAKQEAPIGRCNVCHDQQLPVKTPYYYWHVHARSLPARSNTDIVRICAVCHSNPKIEEHFKIPNTVASYLASFHGKATMLGSKETATCLNCHVSEIQNVHMMQSYKEDNAPTNSSRLADTCRNPNCHATAGYRVSSAAVHMDLATNWGIEFLIACLFILMILSTFGPSLALTALELLQIIAHRHDPEHFQNVRLAEKLLVQPEGRKFLKRFTPHQRIQHWVLFISFTTLVITGFPIKFADESWSRWVIGLFGSLSVTRKVHHWAGVLLLAGFAYHLAYLTLYFWKKKQAEGKGLVRTILALPLVMNFQDWKHMVHLVGYLLFLTPTRPKGGRFSPEEKFEYFGVFWGVLILGATGILLWGHAWTSRFLPGRILTIALLIHSFEAFLALLHVGVLHMVGVIFSPSVFPLSPAMVTGNTPSEEMAETHAAMLEEAEKKIQTGKMEEKKHG
ncbi:MAG: cytochrome b/b6 domain-containing protein [Phycisphaerae bacterium]